MIRIFLLLIVVVPALFAQAGSVDVRGTVGGTTLGARRRAPGPTASTAATAGLAADTLLRSA